MHRHKNKLKYILFDADFVSLNSITTFDLNQYKYIICYV